MNRKQRRSQAKTAPAPPPRTASLEVQTLLEAALQRHRQGQYAEAEQFYRQLLRLDPRHADGLHLYGMLASRTGLHALALDLVGQALAVSPANGLYHVSYGAALAGLGRADEALENFRTAVRLDPANADAQANLGSLLLARGHPEEAAAALAEAVRLRPGFAKAHSELGTALRALGRPEASAEACRAALRLDPNNAVAMSNLGNALKDLGRTMEAMETYDRAIAIQPNLPEIHANRGNALDELGRFGEAIANFDRAIELNPTFAEAHLYRALAMMKGGDFKAGLPRYEWRKKLAALPSAALTEPEWTGSESLVGRSLFIYSEQGLGDTIQFCRYASMAADQGARVVMSAQASLLPLLEGFDPRVAVIGEGLAPVDIDFHCALLSLPLAFGTTPGTIPAPMAYIRADPARAAAWRDRLGGRTRPRIGLAWSGNASHKNDRNRSIPLDLLSPLLKLPADWIGLQKEVRDHDRPALGPVRDFAAELTDFAETAALVEALDLVVTVDTSVAHLAGAMGKPTLMLLPFSGDWRWGLKDETSAWYPTARLLRQPAPGDWPTAIAQAGAAVERQLG